MSWSLKDLNTTPTPKKKKSPSPRRGAEGLPEARERLAEVRNNMLESFEKVHRAAVMQRMEEQEGDG